MLKNAARLATMVNKMASLFGGGGCRDGAAGLQGEGGEHGSHREAAGRLPAHQARQGLVLLQVSSCCPQAGPQYPSIT